MTVPQISLKNEGDDAELRGLVKDEELLSKFDGLDLQVIGHLHELTPKTDLFRKPQSENVKQVEQGKINLIIGSKGKTAHLKSILSEYPNSFYISFSGDQSAIWTSHLEDVHSLIVARLLYSWLYYTVKAEDVSFADVHGRIVGSPLDISWFFKFMDKLHCQPCNWVIGVDDLHEASKYSTKAPQQILEAIALSDLSRASWFLTTSQDIDSTFNVDKVYLDRGTPS